ncbi:unannotated protein [freshwater metagenome]|uniref:Unannotated protein n=1 Tax=freshwater metagenome TaxID=449393 RepID=A0A6J6NZP0_9ZZZZ
MATAALGARREIENALPGHVLNRTDTEDVVITWIFKVDGLAIGEHHWKLSKCDRAVGIALEEDVEEGEEAMPCNTHGEVDRDGDEPSHRNHDLDRCYQHD